MVLAPLLESCPMVPTLEKNEEGGALEDVTVLVGAMVLA